MPFVPVRNQGHGPYNDGAEIYYHPASDTVALRVGDPVVLTGDSHPVTGVSTAARAAPGGAVFGVVAGFRPVDAIIANEYGLGSTEFYFYVEHSDDTEFEVTEDGIGGFIPSTAVGQNIDLIIPTPTGKFSSAILDSSTAATTATLPFRLLGLSTRTGNGFGTLQTIWRVKLNKTTDTSGTTGV